MNIKLTTVIFSVLILQTSASFFDGFRGAFVTVENSFGKLFNDVVADVKVTIDCTILAVERVFSYGGTFGEPSDYERRCKGESGDPPGPTDVRYDSYTTSAEARLQEPTEVTHKINEVKKEITQELDKTLSNVNQTINTFLDLSGAHKEIEKVETALKNETDRLAEISALLKKTIDNLSGNMRLQLKKMDLNQNKSTVKDVLKEVKLLQEVENSNTNATEITEIRRVFDEVLGVLDSDNNYKTLSNYDQVKEIVNSLEKMSNETYTDVEDVSVRKNNETGVLTNIENNFTENKSHKPVHKTTTDAPKTFKDMAKKLFHHPDIVQQKDLVEEFDETFGNPEPTEIVTESPPSSTTIKTLDYEVQPLPDEPRDISQLDMSVLNSFFAPPDEKSREEAVKDAAKLIEQSKFSNMIMNNFFKRADQQNMPSVFDNPDLLNFDET